MMSQSPEFSQFRCRSRIRRRSQSAASFDPDRCHAVTSNQEDEVGNDDDDTDANFDWERRRRSSNNVLSSRVSKWLQRQLLSFGGAARVAYGQELHAAAAPPRRETPTVGANRPHTAAASVSSTEVLHLTPNYDCKCVSCPELADTPSSNVCHGACCAHAANKQRCDVSERPPPRHHAVRKTCSDTGFKTSSMTSDADMTKRSLLAVPAVFVTSYTRSIERQPQQQQLQERRQSTSVTTRQRLLSMSDSRLETNDHFASSSAAARIWKLTEFLCIGNAAAAADDRLLCRHSVFGLIDLCVSAAPSPGHADRCAPCACRDQRRHRRAVLRLNVSRTDLSDIHSYFPAVNRFVDGFRRRRSDSSLSSTPLPLGCVMVYCETGDTLSVLAAAQYLVAVEGQTVDQVEECLAQAGCVTPLVEAFAAVLYAIYNQRNHVRAIPPPPAQHHHHQQQQPEQIKSGGVDVVTQISTVKTSASRRQRLPRQRSESTILNGRSARPLTTVEAWPENS